MSHGSPPGSGSPPEVASPTRDARAARRTSLFAAKVNGGLWSIGNGLLGSTLVLYVAGEIKSDRLGLSTAMILAAPKLVGLLRLAAPEMIGRVAKRKTLAIAAYLLSVLCLIPLPLCALETNTLAPQALLATIVVAWSLYHLCEYIGTVALWSWCGDLLAPRVRGRFWGRRERWILIGNLTAMVAAAVFNERIGPPLSLSRGESLAATGALGVLFLGLAVLPLCWMREAQPFSKGATSTPHGAKSPWFSSLFPLLDPNFRRWLWCGGWMSACNGLTQSAQFFCIKDNLGISFATRQKLDASLKLGQWAIARPIGAAIDRWGAVNTLLVSQTVAASGLLFLAAGSTAGGWWWAIPAWICWTAFAGHNVGLPALTVNLASPGRTAAYVALYLAFADLCYALATLTGGALWDAFRNTTVDLGSLGEPSFLSVFLLAGWGLRMLVLLGLRRVVEPHRRDR